MKICFYALRPYDELLYVEKLNKNYGFDYCHTPDYPDSNNIKNAEGCQAISVTPCDLSAPVLEKFAALGVKYILNRSIGYDHVDLKRASELGIKVASATYPPEGVANYAIMLMMACARKLSHILKRSEVQDYTLKGKIGLDISSATIGIIGTGKIGTTVVKHLSGFGCKMLCYDPYHNTEAEQYAKYVDLDTLYKECDVITIHSNATEENYHLLNKEAFAKMKDGVIIVNTSRGKLIDSDALVEALESGKVGSAALDVLENESGLYYYNRTGEVIANDEMALFRAFPNVILTPHTAFYTTQAVENMVLSNFEALDAFSKNVKTFHEVSYR